MPPETKTSSRVDEMVEEGLEVLKPNISIGQHEEGVLEWFS
jgi:hypothetical protein